LPASARKHAPWWGNAKKPTGQSRYWMSASRLARPDMKGRKVTFRRDGVVETKAPKARPATRQEMPQGDLRTVQPAVLTASGEYLRTTVAYEWQHAGSASVVKGKIGLPVLPARPGVYRFVITHPGGSTSTYVGETENLFKQMGSMRYPGPDQQIDQRLNSLLSSVLESGGSVTVDALTAGLLGGDAIDLSTRPGRCLLENTALCDLSRVGAAIENP